jgi:hypothetical protein
LLIASSTFWIGLGIRIVAEEMHSPVPDAVWQAVRTHTTALSERWMLASLAFVIASGSLLWIGLRDRSRRPGSLDVVSIANISAAILVALTLATVAGFFIAAGLQRI